ncbi:MAG TPA: NAD(P)H-dependent oxidoreductase [Reyranella sp.]|nr:NAD(P)H-dependent oxidoreductase [Reyranella sp.]
MLLKGRSACVIVTMGRPARIYRWYFLARGLKNLERNILRYVGFSPVRHTLIGGLGNASRAALGRRLAEVRELGRRGV